MKTNWKWLINETGGFIDAMSDSFYISEPSYYDYQSDDIGMLVAQCFVLMLLCRETDADVDIGAVVCSHLSDVFQFILDETCFCDMEFYDDEYGNYRELQMAVDELMYALMCEAYGYVVCHELESDDWSMPKNEELKRQWTEYYKSVPEEIASWLQGVPDETCILLPSICIWHMPEWYDALLDRGIEKYPVEIQEVFRDIEADIIAGRFVDYGETLDFLRYKNQTWFYIVLGELEEGGKCGLFSLSACFLAKIFYLKELICEFGKFGEEVDCCGCDVFTKTA